MTIKLYTGPSCSACTKLKGRLDALDITTVRYTEADVNEPANRADVVKLGFRGIPLLVKYNKAGEMVSTLMGASYPDSTYKEFFSFDVHASV
jgi:glutaredoxin|tara:strand:- start:2514 stop:2789 length:276 start_codon:yes stop_codon:yes gene_type:complete